MTRLILALSLAAPMAACRVDGSVTWADGGDSPLVTSPDAETEWTEPGEAPLLNTPAVGTHAPGDTPGTALWLAHGGMGQGDIGTAIGGHGGDLQIDIGGAHPSTADVGSGPTGVEFWSTGGVQAVDATAPSPESHATEGIWQTTADTTVAASSAVPSSPGPEGVLVAGELYRLAGDAYEVVHELVIADGHTLTVMPDAGIRAAELRLSGSLQISGHLVLDGGMNQVQLQARQIHIDGEVDFLGDGSGAELSLHSQQVDGTGGDVVIAGVIRAPKAAGAGSTLYGHAGSLLVEADSDLHLTGTIDLTAGLQDGPDALLPGSRGIGGTARLHAAGQLHLSGAIHTQGCLGNSPFDAGDSGDVILDAVFASIGGLVDTHGLDAGASGTDAGSGGSVELTVRDGGFVLAGTFDLRGGSADGLEEGSGGDGGHLDLHAVPATAPDPEIIAFTDLSVGADLLLQGGDSGSVGAGGSGGSVWVRVRSTQMTSPPLVRFVGYGAVDLRGADGARGGDAGDVQTTIDHAQARRQAYAPGWFSESEFLMSGGASGGRGGDFRVQTLQDDELAAYPTIVRGKLDLSQGFGDAPHGVPGTLSLRNSDAVELRAPVVMHSRGADDTRHERPAGLVDIEVPFGPALLAGRIFGLPPQTTGNGRPGCEVHVTAEQITARGAIDCPGGDGASGGDGGRVMLQSTSQETDVEGLVWDVSAGEGPNGPGREGKVEVDGQAR